MMTSTDMPAAALLAIELDHYTTLVRPRPGEPDAVCARAEQLIGQLGRTESLPERSGRGRFTLVLPAACRSTLRARAQRLVERVAATDFGSPRPAPLWLTASAGLAFFEDGQGFETVACAAEAALEAARRAGGNRLVVLPAGDPRAARRAADEALLPQLLAALRESRLRVECQPIVPLAASGSLPPLSALVVHLVTGAGESIDACRYRPVLLRHRCTARLDLEVFARVFRWLESRASVWVDLDSVVAPVHAQSLEDPAFTATLRDRLADAGFPLRRLCLEVVGCAAIADVASVAEAIGALQGLGCRIALDEPSCRSPELRPFTALPADLVRLDSSLVAAQPGDFATPGWLAAMRDLSRACDRRTVAGPCDTAQVLDAVRRLGIDYAQGAAVCEPFPLEQLLPLPMRPVA